MLFTIDTPKIEQKIEYKKLLWWNVTRCTNQHT